MTSVPANIQRNVNCQHLKGQRLYNNQNKSLEITLQMNKNKAIFLYLLIAACYRRSEIVSHSLHRAVKQTVGCKTLM